MKKIMFMILLLCFSTNLYDEPLETSSLSEHHLLLENYSDEGGLPGHHNSHGNSTDV